jgi:spermidine synthase
MSVLPTQKLRFIALATTIITGFTGLVYEVTWHKYLSNIIGSEARATAIILAVFLGGLSIGYEVFGRLSRGKSPNFNLKTLAYCELVIGIWALMFDQIFGLLTALTAHLPVTGVGGLMGELLAACFLLLIPTILMGGTLPLLTQGLNFGLRDAPKFHSKIYALNTGGAFLGCLTAGFYFLPFHGLPLTMFYMAILNLASGLVLGLVATSLLREDIAKELESLIESDSNRSTLNDSSNDSSKGSEFLGKFPAFVIATLAGVYSICLQTILVRMTGLSLGSSEYAFSMVVSLFIFMLAVGASGVSKIQSINLSDLRKNQWVMLLGSFVVFLTIPYWPYINHLVRISFGHSKIAFYMYFLASFFWMGIILTLALGCMGRTLPLLFSVCQQSREKIGSFIGSLYGLNTLGCVLGALLGGYVALYFFDLDQMFRFMMLSMLVTIVLATKVKSSVQSQILLGITFVVLLLAPSWDKTQLGFGLFRMAKERADSYSGKDEFYNKTIFKDTSFVAYKDGPSGTVSVYADHPKANGQLTSGVQDIKNSKASGEVKLEDPASSLQSTSNELSKVDDSLGVATDRESKDKEVARSILVNGKSDGSTDAADLKTTTLIAHLPALLHKGTTGRAAVIGFGTGITVGNLALHPTINSIDCIEISNVVRDFASLFTKYNLNAGTDPKVNWITADAFRVLTSSKSTYDVIISEPSNPWVTGIERLFTLDFLKIVKGKLSPGGIYAQWFHTYSIAEDTFNLVVKTYSSVFPYIYTFQSNETDLIMLGSLTELDASHLAQLEERFQDSRVSAELKKVKVNSAANLIGLEVLNPTKAYSEAGLHTLENPRLSYMAGKDFFMEKTFTLSRLIETPRLQTWGIPYATMSMHSKYSDMLNQRDSASQKAGIFGLCNLPVSDSLPKEWFSLTRQCRYSLFKAVKDKLITLDPSTAIEETRDLFAPVNAPGWGVKNAMNFLALYNVVHSDFAPIAKDELMTKMKVCLETETAESQKCVVTYIRTLYHSGYFSEADSLVQAKNSQLVNSYGTTILDTFSKIADESKRADKSYRKL